MSYTPEQLDAIHTHDHNLIVTAGAGSGKTRVLVDRFVAMLEAHPDWSLPSVVAITFTEKAAREMRDRVRKAIEDRISAASQAQDYEALRLWRDHQAALDSARIGTIHSLCTSILRSNAAEVEIDPAFEVLDEIEAAMRRDDAVEQALARLTEESTEAVRLLAEYDVRTVRNVLFNMIALPDESLPVSFDYLDTWRRDYDQKIGGALMWLRQDAAFTSALMWEPLNGWPAADKLLASWELVVTRRDVVMATNAAPEAVIGVLAQWYNEIKLVGGTAGAWGGKEELDIAKANLKFIRATCESILEQLGDFGEADARAADLLPLWGEAIAATKAMYKEVKRRRRALDFDDLETLTRRLLGRKEVASRYQNAEFKHILVDEFQDTNAAQRDIIRALAGTDRHGSLFVVGDPRQSIYQFRGADVRVFENVRTEMLTTGGREILLNTSFRTHEQLVNGFNNIFSTLMVRGDGPNADFAVTLGSPMQAFRSSNGQPTLEIILIDKEQAPKHSNSADDLRHWEAAVLARRLKEMVEDGWQVWDKANDEHRPLQYGDVAVLFQASKNMQIVEEAFKSAHIPYVTVAGKGYYNRPEVWDLLNLLKALYNPADDLALASVLRSPLFNLSDDDLFALRLQRRGTAGGHLSLWVALTNQVRTYDPPLPDQQQVEFARESLLRLRGVAGRVTIAELLVRTLDETAFLATLSGLPDGARRVGNVEKLLEVARRSGRVVLGEFTQYLQDLTEREAREGEAVVATEGVVQLMTVHASKGLEFPVVALFDASWEGKPRVDTLVIDPVLGPACCVRDEEGETLEPFVFRMAKRYAAEREAAERIRLLYVAMTRAQDYVIVSGRDDSSKGWLSQLISALGLASVSLTEEMLVPFDWGNCLVRVPTYTTRVSTTSGDMEKSSESRETVRAWDQLSSEPVTDVEAVQPSLLATVLVDRHAPTRIMTASEIAVLGEAKATGRLSQFRQHVLGDAPTTIRQVTGAAPGPHVSRRVVGEIVHQALRWWRLPSNTPDLNKALESYAWEQGVTDPQMLQNAVNEAAELLERTERSGIIAQINQAHQVFRELPFTFTLGNRTINGVIDVLFFSKYQRWNIVDYKTAVLPEQHEKANLATRLREHAVRYYPQVGVYAAAVESMTGQAPEVHMHYIRYVQTLDIEKAVWQAVLTTLDDDIMAAVDDS